MSPVLSMQLDHILMTYFRQYYRLFNEQAVGKTAFIGTGM